MTSARTRHRVIGALLLLQMTGLIAPFVLLHPLMQGADYYLAHAADAAGQIRLAVFLLLANCALTIAISIALFGVLRRRSEGAALWLLTASVIMFLLQAVDNAHVLSMVSLSQQYAAAGGARELFQTLAVTVGATRRWVHLSELLAIDLWIASLYVLLYRFALVPRLLSLLGLATVLLHAGAIPLRAFLGYGSIMSLGPPMAVAHVALAAWLLARGLAERDEGLARAHRELEAAEA